MHPYPPLVRIAPKITAGIAAALGLLMAAAGLGLGFALLTSGQPPLQFATAAILLTTGAVNLASSRGLWKENRAALAASAAATATLLAYQAALATLANYSFTTRCTYYSWLRSHISGARSQQRPDSSLREEGNRHVETDRCRGCRNKHFDLVVLATGRAASPWAVFARII